MIEHDDDNKDVSHTDGLRSAPALCARELAERFGKRRLEPLQIPEAQAPPESSIDLPALSRNGSAGD
jgi:hypothetical protein